MMRKTIIRTLAISTIHGFMLEVSEGTPTTKTLEPVTVIGKCTEKEGLKVLKEKFGKDKAITICNIEVDEATYEITVEDFLAHAKKIEKTETEEN